ncbi:hypothetical protein C8R43DRAFT_481203 [Mycena crocata]|nr:hypothetical protein C8R43DRAFT_480982 [Mycena crocata]KAJ7152289.1 hypothetical protein C8R43DRAFT_481071 [Mycena crocata]KAJ7152293.1 hypothetical protein C8R43DRAFT_481203 [Mycena crocata]
MEFNSPLFTTASDFPLFSPTSSLTASLTPLDHGRTTDRHPGTMAIRSAPRQLGLDSDLNFNLTPAAITPIDRDSHARFLHINYDHRLYRPLHTARLFEPLPTSTNAESSPASTSTSAWFRPFYTSNPMWGPPNTGLEYDVQDVAHSGAPWPSTSSTNTPPHRKTLTPPYAVIFSLRSRVQTQTIVPSRRKFFPPYLAPFNSSLFHVVSSLQNGFNLGLTLTQWIRSGRC